MDVEGEGTCYGSGSIAGAIIGTALITIGLGATAALLYNLYWRSRKGQHLVLVTDIENPSDQYAFDNPGFREATPIKQNLSEEKPNKLDRGWLGGLTPRSHNLKTVDDSCLSDSQVKMVSLKSRDFTGLGFSVCGNMRDGIFVKDLMHRGPAFESGCINPGDRILRMSISFRHMVYEDALTILSYASPYDVQLDVEHNPVSRPATLLRSRRDAENSSGERIRHPFYRSQSSMDLPQIGKFDGRGPSQSSGGKSHDLSQSFSDYPTLKLTPVGSTEKSDGKRGDTVDGSDTLNRLHKLGIRVLPTSLSPKHKIRDNAEGDDRDVKTMLSKGLQNLKEKINHNTLGRKKKDDDSDLGVSELPVAPCEDVPEEVARAGEVARNSRHLHSVNVSTPTEPIIPPPQTISSASNDSTNSQISNDSSNDSLPKIKKSKGKAPAPPQSAKEESPATEQNEVNEIQVDDGHFQEIEPRAVSDSESDEEDEAERSCTRATVHHSPAPDEVESGRKAASLGDLSRLDIDSVPSAPLERAVSLDLDASQNGKKRKAPPVPVEDFPGAFDDVVYCKEPRIEGYNTFQRRLKKSSEYGTLEDALQDDTMREEHIEEPCNPKSLESCSEIQVTSSHLIKPPEIVDILSPQVKISDMEHIAAANIQEFSSWLAEVRKEPEGKQLHTTVSVNGATTDLHSSQNDITLTVNRGHEDDPIIDPKASFTLMVNGQNVAEPTRTVLFISQPNSLGAEENLDNETEETPPQLPTSPIPSAPSSSLTYITEINVSEAKESKPPRKDVETSKIPIRTLRSETGQRVLAAIQQLQMSPPPAVPPRRTEVSELKDRSALNGTGLLSTHSIPVKTSATKIVFESHGPDAEEF